MRFVAGALLNFLEGAAAVTPSATADTRFPITRLYDNLSSLIFAFGTLTTDPYVTVDLDRLGATGGFESFTGGGTGTPVGWTEADTGTGSVIQETSNTHSGSSAVALAGGASGVGLIYKDFTARAGQRFMLDVWLRGNGTQTAKCRVQNLTTGKYLTSGGAWQTASAEAASRTTASYAQTQLAFTVENWTLCQASTVTIRVSVLCTENGTVYADDVCVYPTLNIVSVHGHNIAPLNTVELHSSTDAFSSNDVTEATLTPLQGRFYSYLSSPITKRYMRLKCVGTNPAIIYCAELLLSYIEQATQGPEWGVEMRSVESQIRNESEAGDVTVHAREPHERMLLKLAFVAKSEAAYKELRDEIVRRCRGGIYPMLIIPIDGEDIIVLGTLEDAWEVRRQFITRWTNDDLAIAERPFPIVTP
jgi:hypothetical protein